MCVWVSGQEAGHPSDQGPFEGGERLAPARPGGPAPGRSIASLSESPPTKRVHDSRPTSPLAASSMSLTRDGAEQVSAVRRCTKAFQEPGCEGMQTRRQGRGTAAGRRALSCQRPAALVDPAS